MSVAALITTAKGAGTVKVTSGGAEFPILRIEEKFDADGPSGLNGRTFVTRTFTIDSMSVAGSEDVTAVGALKASLASDLARRGDAVFIAELGGTARTLRSGGDVTGISGAGTTTVPGYPVVSIDFDAEKSVGAVVFFTLKITTVEVTFGSTVSGYNVVHFTRSRSWREDSAGNVSTTVRGEVTVKPGQSASAYIAEMILTPARTAAAGAGLDFTSTRNENSLDLGVCGYEYTTQAPAWGGGGFSSATTVDESDVTRGEVAGAVKRTISGTVKGPSAFSTAQGRRLSPTPANHVLVAERIGQPNTLTGEVAYEYEYRTGKQGTGSGLTSTYFFSFSQSVTESGGDRAVVVAEFDDADPVIGFMRKRAAAYTETTDFEFTGAVPAPDNIPRATGVDAAHESSRRSFERRASAPGLLGMRLVRTYLKATPYTTPPTAVTSP